MGKQSPDLARLIGGIKSALAERDEVARSIAGRMEAAESKVRDAHAELDRFLSGGVGAEAVEPAVVEPADAPVSANESDEIGALRRKVAAGLIDEAPCESVAKHEPHAWDDEIATVFCPGLERSM